MKKFKLHLTLPILLIALIFTAGCNSDQLESLKLRSEQANHVVQTSNDVVQQAEAQRDVIVEQFKDLPPGPERDALLEKAQKYSTIIEEYTELGNRAAETLDSLNAQIQQADDGLDVAQGVIVSAANFIPPPYGQIVSVLTPLVIGVVGLFIGKKKGRKEGLEIGTEKAIGVARSIEVVKDPAGKVDFGDPEVKRRLSLLLGAEGKAIVDTAQSKL